VSLLATERNKIQLAWEDSYVKKVNFWQEIDLLILQDIAAVEAASSSNTNSQNAVGGNVSTQPLNLPAPGEYAWETGDKVLHHHEGGDKKVIKGQFEPVKDLDLARISGGRVITTSMARKEYTKKRVLATQQTSAAGFMSISEDMYLFTSEAKDENIFAPDFIPVLYMIHGKIKHLYPNGKVTGNSGYRWWKGTDGVEFSPHEAGIAIDIGTRNPDHSINLKRGYEIADVCWEMGLRGVFVAESFVHVDISSDGGGWAYPPVPSYRGPESH
jgi:hypothetical protein